MSDEHIDSLLSTIVAGSEVAFGKRADLDVQQATIDRVQGRRLQRDGVTLVVREFPTRFRVIAMAPLVP